MELGHGDLLTVYVDPNKIYVALAFDLFSEATSSMVLKFHMQHDQTAGLQSGKIQSSQESKMAAVTKCSKPIKSSFSGTTWYIWLKFCI